MKQTVFRVGSLLAALAAGPSVPLAFTQTATPSASGQDAVLSMNGTVISSSRNTLTVKSETGFYVVYIFDRFTSKPATLPKGMAVTVISTPTGEQGVRLATDIMAAKPAAPGDAGVAAPPAGSTQRPSANPYETGETVPVSVRKLEGDIERQSRRFSAGFRAGVGLDPELMLVGVQARIGPFFNRNFSFRPNVDFGFGEVTKMFAIDLNGVYRLPLNPRGSRWSMFVGAGPNLTFRHRNFEEAAEGRGIDFGDFDFDSGLNVLIGAEFRSGFFVEGKTTVWAGPHLRITLGYSF